MKTIFLMIALSATLFLTAQNAPNFTVTTTQNQTVSLYEDYLDSGKTVVIKVFFTTCPLCTPYNVPFQNLYENWGSGTNGVEFFLMSNQNWDQNADVAAYEISRGLTFPGVGNDGGALLALQPYITGQFGDFFGTPTFIVIAPDGTVHFNIRQNNVTNTINAIDSVIALTRIVQPPISAQRTISGTCSLPNGNPIPDVNLFVTNLDDQNQQNHLLNSPTFSILDTLFPPSVMGVDNYTMAANKVDSNYLNGVSTYDLVLIQKHILGISLLNDYQKLAADANCNGSVSTIDIVDFRRLILQVQDTLMCPAWRFSINHPAFNWSSNFLDSLQIIGVKMGDVNYSYVPFANSAEVRNKDDLQLSVKQRFLPNGQVAYDFYGSCDTPLSAMQYTIAFDKRIQFNHIEAKNLPVDENYFALNQLENGLMAACYYAVSPIILNNSLLYSIIFDKLNDQPISAMQINDAITSSKAFDENGVELRVQFQNENNSKIKSNAYLYPNPVEDWLYFENIIPQQKMCVFNQLGQSWVIEKHDNKFKVSQLPKGIYSVQLEQRENIQPTLLRFIKK